MRLPHAPLEDWMRHFYFDTKIDLGSSGVQPWTLSELRRLLGIHPTELDSLAFDDSESYGGRELREVLAVRFGVDDPDRVMATHGSTEAIFVAMNALLTSGDEVVVVDPAYHSLRSVAEAIGCRIKRWRLRPEDGFRPCLDILRPLLTSRTRMVIVNFPHNPTGATLTRDQFDAFLDLVADHGAYLVWDGAFTELVYDTPPLPEPALRYARCVSIGTMSKAYGLPGTRVGWCLATPEILTRFVPLRDAISICLSPLTEFFAARAIAQADRILDVRRAQAARNRQRLADWIRHNSELVSWTRPDGGCTAFPTFAGIEDTEDLCRELGARHDVLLVPGSAFGHPDRVRLGFGGDEAAFVEGLDRLQGALRARRGAAHD
ncbi:capreomycidine synthase (plasmid) [Streptomyces tendae]|uniref:Capreomycidine synthase n=2 Tax=Streptomyces tendae TaxID=1932 RepID=A0ABX6A229_STRTE|nr:capreomycidine synthase [Streptomyces tendae]